MEDAESEALDVKDPSEENDQQGEALDSSQKKTKSKKKKNKKKNHRYLQSSKMFRKS